MASRAHAPHTRNCLLWRFHLLSRAFSSVCFSQCPPENSWQLSSRRQWLLCNCCTGPDAFHNVLYDFRCRSRDRAPADLEGMSCGAKTGGDGRPLLKPGMKPCGPNASDEITHIAGETAAAPRRDLSAQRPTATVAVANLLGHTRSCRE